MSNTTIQIKYSSTQGVAPASLAAGELAINIAEGRIYYKDYLDVIKPYGIVHVGSSAPSSPKKNELWWDSDVGSLFIYYDDGSSTQWVEATAQPLVESPTGTFNITGNLIITGNATVQGTLFETSDMTLKTEIETVENALESLQSLRGVNFKWKENKNKSMGLIAQEVESVFPYLIQNDSKGIKSINYTALIGVLIQAIKELDDKVEKQNKKISIWGKIKNYVLRRDIT